MCVCLALELRVLSVLMLMEEVGRDGSVTHSSKWRSSRVQSMERGHRPGTSRAHHVARAGMESVKRDRAE